MFRAAAGTRAVTRPLLVFYGLSQVGRAIAAAAASAGSGGWELEGHGIRCVPGTLRGPLPGPATTSGNESHNSVTGLATPLRVLCLLTRETGNRATRQAAGRRVATAFLAAQKTDGGAARPWHCARPPPGAAGHWMEMDERDA